MIQASANQPEHRGTTCRTNPAAADRSRPDTFAGKRRDVTLMDYRKVWTTLNVKEIVLSANVGGDLRRERQ